MKALIAGSLTVLLGGALAAQAQDAHDRDQAPAWDTLTSIGLRRCGLPPESERPPVIQQFLGGGAGDCSAGSTNPAAIYDPVTTYQIPVVVHVIRNSTGTSGNISMALVQSQIDILNEDFRATPGTNGANGTDSRIEFFLATQDPGGAPTTGVTYSNNTTWYNDGGSYWNSLAWDTNRYLNIYTNQAGGALGYVPGLPAGGGLVGSNNDRVVVYWPSFGLNGPIGPPYNKGRTTTHEVGHYLGLEHTFSGGCAGGSCFTGGDLICDTNNESGPFFGCGNRSTCGNSDPTDNYMDYTDDLCMEKFTPQQVNRMRCTLEHWRSNLAGPAGPAATATIRNGTGVNPLGFQSGTLPLWGEVWDSTIALGGNFFSFVALSLNGPVTLNSANGQILIAPPLAIPLDPGFGSHAILLPASPTLIGLSIQTQGITYSPGFQFQNAIDLVVGF